ncbi:hypothetical protein [Porphyromonas macacae]|uniref:hypothetical protein n=1 Tax=Porphyromonas macacae TaxID=28115 RepID=UPI00359FDD52
MRKLIDYIAYRLFWIYQKKDPAPLATTTSLVILTVTSSVYFICTLTLKVVFSISIDDIYPENPRLFTAIYIFGIGGIVFWRIKKRYTEKYIATTLTSRFQNSKYNKKIKGWMMIVACLLCFFACGISASMID